eukprot:TRINITY_DN20023_c0_g1_i1.p1 TRINITY_DN20023_c0_g1~~TRINITY_DN20023_c0_g1_i1.p1  ORF type:complete len:332 (-),score=50.93 TRINITY_DN20023_c0_g1_i1:22-1017(-)
MLLLILLWGVAPVFTIFNPQGLIDSLPPFTNGEITRINVSEILISSKFLVPNLAYDSKSGVLFGQSSPCTIARYDTEGTKWLSSFSIPCEAPSTTDHFTIRAPPGLAAVDGTLYHKDGYQGLIIQFDGKGNPKTQQMVFPEQCYENSIAHDGNYLICMSQDQNIHRIDPVTFEFVKTMSGKFTQRIRSVSHLKGHLCGVRDSTLEVLHLQTGAIVDTCSLPEGVAIASDSVRSGVFVSYYGRDSSFSIGFARIPTIQEGDTTSTTTTTWSSMSSTTSSSSTESWSGSSSSSGGDGEGGKDKGDGGSSILLMILILGKAFILFLNYFGRSGQ